jgi:sialic acid synthase SpsE
MNIGPLKVGPGEPCAIVAEIGNAHNGSFDRAIRLLDAAKACGASAGKLQTYTPQELVDLRGDGPAPEPWGSDGWTMRTLYERAQTPLAWIPDLFAHAASIGLPLFSSVFGPDSLAALEAVGNPAYKIAKLDNAHEPLRAAAVATGKTVVVSAVQIRGDWEEVVAQYKLREDIDACLYCPGSYPCAPSDVRLRSVPFFSESGFIGLSSHCLDPRLPIAAVARGAKLLEYHFMLDAEPSELESNVSLGESAFRRMVDDVRATEVLLG